MNCKTYITKIMEELLSLKWNNHKNSFLQQLSNLRGKSTYTDVTLACDGQLYNVHKMVLSACSDYFSTIFESILCTNPVIVLKDMSAENLEALLDYMYLGEVSVRQSELASLIQSAECLKMKGLAVPEGVPFDKTDKRKRPSPVPSPIDRKRLRKSNPRSIASSHIELSNNSDEHAFNIEPPLKILSQIKQEKELQEIVNFKEESDTNKREYTDPWDFAPDPDNASLQYDKDAETEESNNPTLLASTNELIQINNCNSQYASEFESQPPVATGSQPFLNEAVSSDSSSRKRVCDYCSKAFKRLHDLTRHLKIHTGEKPFCCSFCSKTFLRLYDLRRHVRIHTGERPYPCPFCSYKAKVKTHLTTHISMTHTNCK